MTAPVEAPHDHAKPLTAIGTNIAPSRGPLPPDYASASFARHGAIWDNDGTSRQWLDSWYLWHAPALYHNPLYFEEVNLERYGYGARFGQPVLSAASFFGRIPLLPYLVVAEPPDECVYTLGHYRPGNCVPFQIHRPPISKRGALYQSAVVTSLFFLIP